MSQNTVAGPPQPGSCPWLWDRYKRAIAAQRKISSHARWGPRDVRDVLLTQLASCLATWPKSLRRRAYVAFYLMMMADRGWCIRDPDVNRPLIKDLSELRTWSEAWEDDEDARWAVGIMVDQFTGIEPWRTSGMNGITSPIDLSKAISLCFVGAGTLVVCMEMLDLVIQAFEKLQEEEESRGIPDDLSPFIDSPFVVHVGKTLLEGKE